MSTTLEFDVNFVHPPRPTCGAFPAVGLVSDVTRVFFAPSIKGCVIHGNAALGHNLFKIAIQDAIPNVETDRVQDHRFRAMRTFETDQLFNPDIGAGKRGTWIRLPRNATLSRKFATLPLIDGCVLHASFVPISDPQKNGNGQKVPVNFWPLRWKSTLSPGFSSTPTSA